MKKKLTIEFDCPKCSNHASMDCKKIDGELDVNCKCGYNFLSLRKKK